METGIGKKWRTGVEKIVGKQRFWGDKITEFSVKKRNNMCYWFYPIGAR
ncbi:hypothetical protein [Hymenobacter coccineus]|nr:hypothetical protein [Hymenobacter coccineus]